MSGAASPRREHTPSGPPASIPQKRALEDDYSPAVPSPLNPDVRAHRTQVQFPDDTQAMAREKRTKKDSLKKREAKGAGPDSSRATPDPKQREPPPGELAPLRYKLAQPRPSDFELPRGPVFTSHHEVQGPEGRTIEFCETSDQ